MACTLSLMNLKDDVSMAVPFKALTGKIAAGSVN